MRLANMKISLLIVLAVTLSIRTHAQGDRQARRDSLSNLSMRHVPSSAEQWYLIDSLLVLNEADFGKISKYLRKVLLVSNKNDSVLFYSYSGRTIIIDGKVITKQSPPFKTRVCQTARIKAISDRTLRSRFGISNTRGAFVVDCYYARRN